jgi:hypothetical protein
VVIKSSRGHFATMVILPTANCQLGTFFKLDLNTAVIYFSPLMRKTITLFLLPVFIYSIIGWQWIFVMQLNDHQSKEFSSYYEDEELEMITVNANDVQGDETFLVNNHELFHHGKYFDIKYKKTKGDKIVFYCHSDKEEGSLYASLDLRLKDASGMAKSSSQKSPQVVKLSVFDNEQGQIFIDQDNFSEINFPYIIAKKTIAQGNAVFVPPDASVLIS